ncbi:MAG TPA: terminase gpA endonuclease subunit [Gemmataceae bacterium]|nr:terminase gpA endonuclease subunit [Gemmataceae bacterium]
MAESPTETTGNPSAYAAKLAYQTQKNAANAKAHNNVGPIPQCGNPERRAACEADAELFYKTYFPKVFPLPFSDDHREFIRTAEQVIESGGMVPLVMPRGSGKTALCRRLVLRAILYGRRKYVFLINADAPLANRSLEAIKSELRFNQLLYDDFPEVCHPIRRLEGKAVRVASQHVDGVPTLIVWNDGRLVFPTVAGSLSSGAVIDVAGIEGQIRGRNILRSDGEEIRPDFFVLDDPQTHESALSPSQVETREQILMSDIIHGAGPTQTITGIIPCTVIRKGDLADRILDKKRHPEFRARRFKAIYTLPANTAAWDRYAEVLRDALAEEDDTGKTNAHYEQHREELEYGAVVAWPERMKPGYVSALQELMELKILNPDVFASEYQGDPLAIGVGNVVELARTEIEGRLSNVPCGTIPHGATKLTAFVDVQGIGLLFYTIVAWDDQFTGWVIDYGTYPDQQRRYFTKSSATALLGRTDQHIHAGVKDLAEDMLTRQWPCQSNTSMMLDLLLIDSGDKAELIYEVCRQLRNAGYGARILPSKGEGDTAGNKEGFNANKIQPGERRGFEWKLPMPKEVRGIKLLRYNTNAWKSFVMDRFAVTSGGPGSLTLWGSNHTAHSLFIDHLFAEYRDRKTSERTGRTVDEWHERGNQDNDFWDCLVGATCAASVAGVVLQGVQQRQQQPGPKKKVSWLDQYRQAREAQPHRQ